MTDARKLIQVYEIDVPYCENTYGVAPCTASGSAGEECYNCRSTCQDLPNYAETTKTLRFTNSDTGLPKGQTFFPAMEGKVSTRPTSINVGNQDDKKGALGRRATVSVSLSDFPYHDRFLDKYAATRPYVPEETGTFWRKFKARWPYYKGYAVRVRDGEQGQALVDMRTRYYVLDKIDGPGDNGKVSVKAKDILALADNKRALAPKLTDAALASAIPASGSVTVGIVPASATDDMPATGKAKIGNEAVGYSVAGPGSINITTRGVDGTDPEAHDAGDNVQPAFVVEGVRIDEVIRGLLEDYADVDPAFWDPENATEAQDWLSSLILTGSVYEPTAVNELLGEISEIGTIIWWDEVDQLIKIRAIRPGVGDEIKPVNDGSNILAGSLTFTDHPDEQVSQVWTYFDPIDPFSEFDDRKNYRRINVRRDEAVEEASGAVVVKRQYSRFLNSNNEGAIIANSLRVLNRFIAVPIRGTIELDVSDRGRIWTADVLSVTSDLLTDASGQPQTRLFQVVSAEDIDPGHRVRYEIQSMEPPENVNSRPFYIMPNDTPVYDSATPEQRDPKGGFIVDGNSLQFSDGSGPYQII